VESYSNLVGGIKWLLVGDMSVDNQCVAAGCQNIWPDDGDIVPVTVIERRRRVDDDWTRSVASVEHVPWPPVHQLDGQKVTVDNARPAVEEQAVWLQRTNLPQLTTTKLSW